MAYSITRLSLTLQGMLIALSITELAMAAPAVQVLVPDYPRIEIEIQQSQGQVHFEFFWWRDKTAPAEPKVPVKVQYLTVSLRGEKSPLWIIRSPLASSMTSRITFGVIPQGYVQEEPISGPAPALDVNRYYVVGIMGEGGMGSTTFVFQSP